MTKYELSLAKDYVPDWTVVDAVRELFQNALDQQATVEDNDMLFDYADGELHIGNKSSVLQPKTLLLGSSTKRDDVKTIGKFGEGYKLATLVLTRLGKKLTFYNYGAKEVWTARFVKSQRYGAEILTFFVDKKYPWTKIPDNNLTIVVEGITPDEYELIVTSNLHLQKVDKVIETAVGRILLDPAYAHKVFVNGLYVCNFGGYVHGYDFYPEHLKIDRDRKLADTFELQWLASKMWSGVDHPRAAALVAMNAGDVIFVTSMQNIHPTTIGKTADRALVQFQQTHGEDAVPVATQEEMESVAAAGMKPVITNEKLRDLVRMSNLYVEKVPKKKTPKEQLMDWLRTHHKSLSRQAQKDLGKIIEGM